MNRFALEAKNHSDSEIGQLIIKSFETPGISIEYIVMGADRPWETSQETEYFSRASSLSHASLRDSESLLVSLGVITRFHFDYSYYDGERYLNMQGAHLTDLGADFVSECTDLRFKKPIVQSSDTNVATGRVSFRSRD